MKQNKFTIITKAQFLLIACLILTPQVIWSQQSKPKMVLERAVMCESIENFKPVNPAVVFSITQGEVYCYSAFNPVYEKTTIFHKWYNRDKLIFTMRLVLSPPKWSSFSKIQIRNEDKGPWRVEIRNETGRLIKSLRFSMAD